MQACAEAEASAATSARDALLATASEVRSVAAEAGAASAAAAQHAAATAKTAAARIDAAATAELRAAHERTRLLEEQLRLAQSAPPPHPHAPTPTPAAASLSTDLAPLFRTVTERMEAMQTAQNAQTEAIADRLTKLQQAVLPATTTLPPPPPRIATGNHLPATPAPVTRHSARAAAAPADELTRHPDWPASPHPNPAAHPTPTPAPSHRSASPPQGATNDRHLQLPKFTGMANVDGYFSLFEAVAKGITTDRECWVRYLVSKLEGPAQQWLLGQGSSWEAWGYDELKRELTKHFRGESSVHQRRLLSLRCTGSLMKFHEEFTSAAAAALPIMGAAWVKE